MPAVSFADLMEGEAVDSGQCANFGDQQWGRWHLLIRMYDLLKPPVTCRLDTE